MSERFTEVAADFVEIAVHAGGGVGATVTRGGLPATAIIEVEWRWDGADLHGRLVVADGSPLLANLAATPALSLCYFTGGAVAVADCAVDVNQDGHLRLVPRRLHIERTTDDGTTDGTEWSRLGEISGGDPACWAHLLDEAEPPR